jgi:hypothetical protein
MHLRMRVPIAAIAGCAGFLVYVVAVVTAADAVSRAHWAIQAVFFLCAGLLWVAPARWLMLWAAHRR